MRACHAFLQQLTMSYFGNRRSWMTDLKFEESRSFYWLVCCIWWDRNSTLRLLTNEKRPFSQGRTFPCRVKTGKSGDNWRPVIACYFRHVGKRCFFPNRETSLFPRATVNWLCPGPIQQNLQFKCWQALQTYVLLNLAQSISILLEKIFVNRQKQ